MFLSRKKIFWSVFCAAVIVRVFFSVDFFHSPFACYHLVNGLDMKTLLEFSEWGKNPAVPPFFTVHRWLIWLLWQCNHQVHPVRLLFCLQSAAGILSAMLTADLTLRLCRRRIAALAAGVGMALYLPCPVYEFAVLQESLTLFFYLLAVWSTVLWYGSIGSVKKGIFSGAIWAAALCGRPVILPLAGTAILLTGWRAWKKRKIRGILPMLLTTAILLTTAAGFNYRHGWSFTPFFQVMNYAEQYNRVSGQANSALLVAWNAVKRSPQLLLATELPENLNIYFYREELPVCRILPGPEFLLPLTAAALAALLLSGCRRKGYYCALLPLILLGIPLCAREVIGRYRLLIVPWCWILAAAGICAFSEISGRLKRGLIGAAAIGAAGCSLFLQPVKLPEMIREDDYYARALAAKNGGFPRDEVKKYYLDYVYCRRPPRAHAVIRTLNTGLQWQDLDWTASLLAEPELAAVLNKSIMAYYVGWLYVYRNCPEKVRDLYRQIQPEELTPEMRPYYQKIRLDTEKLLEQKAKEPGRNG